MKLLIIEDDTGLNRGISFAMEQEGYAVVSARTLRDVISKFPALYHAFSYGAPPHAGIAPGVDRMVMLLLDEPNIREIIPFPMNKNAKDLMMNAPAEVSQKQLDDVHIQIKPEK